MENSLQHLQQGLPDASCKECRPQLVQMGCITKAGQTALLLLQAEKNGGSGERIALHRSLAAQYAAIKDHESEARISEESGVSFLQRVLTGRHEAAGNQQ